MQHLNAKTQKNYFDPTAGFTVLEMIIVSVIVGIMAAVSTPSLLSWYNNVQVKNALAESKGALQQAREEAVRRSDTCNTQIDDSNNKITGNCIFQPDISSRVGLNTTNGNISFSFRGTNTLGGAGTIVFFVEDAPDNYDKKCLVVSTPLGIIRTGDYTGDVASPTSENCTTN
ncbi:type 4 pilin [Halothece sp. PCC 7418]|uniref:pilus assembly FimT family protein n=1 Tax=Halothece sp. (strain PCC 7418) TaxID=65093 RepID=UPI0002A05E81|nr:prepilin-type N-terminal cleavage/methylation domain-containing protein [Halothece sp. PCC 7418]AFZ44239.1 type 4 pilin [Halothece sp. PCC 7418]